MCQSPESQSRISRESESPRRGDTVSGSGGPPAFNPAPTPALNLSGGNVVTDTIRTHLKLVRTSDSQPFTQSTPAKPPKAGSLPPRPLDPGPLDSNARPAQRTCSAPRSEDAHRPGGRAAEALADAVEQRLAPLRAHRLVRLTPRLLGQGQGQGQG